MEYLIKKKIPATLEIIYLVKASSEEEALTKIHGEIDLEEVYHDYNNHKFDDATVEIADQTEYCF